MSADRYVVIDEEGYYSFDGKRVADDALGRTMIENLKVDDHGRLVTSLTDVPAFVEYFDAPLLARHVRMADSGHGELDLSYGAKARFAFTSLSLDEWDRFHGVTEKNVPFVLSRQAQMEFFEMLESFDDESVTIAGKTYQVPPWLEPSDEGEQPQFWSDLYKTEQAGWELGQESTILPVILPQLKLVKSRILVLGSGSGHDAAYFAKLGHVVTAVDFSDEALKRAKQKYAELDTLTFVRADIFNLPEKWNEQFDMVFEHTCFCAISPDKRDQLIKVWRRVLQPHGHLLAIFFAFEKRKGPPFGGSEWELRQRLKPAFDFMYWTRWRQSIEKRKGKELVVYARKKN